MKKVLFILLSFIFTQSVCHAINWQEVQSQYKNIAYVDMDSIKEEKDSYFYNIKFLNKITNNYVVLTVQALKSNPFCARLKAYTLEEYESLNGDYENITNKATKDFETITYQSVMYACYKKVKNFKKLEETKNNIIIQQ